MSDVAGFLLEGLGWLLTFGGMAIFMYLLVSRRKRAEQRRRNEQAYREWQAQQKAFVPGLDVISGIDWRNKR